MNFPSEIINSIIVLFSDNQATSHDVKSYKVNLRLELDCLETLKKIGSLNLFLFGCQHFRDVEIIKRQNA